MLSNTNTLLPQITMPPNNYDPYSEEQYEKSDHQNMNDVADDEEEKKSAKEPYETFKISWQG